MVSRRKLAAEALGTALLLISVVGSGIMAEELSGGITALALLANAVATGCMLFVIITTLGPISGAHFNPAVTLVFALRREIEAREGALYVAVQIAGGVLGVIAAHLMFEADAIQFGVKERTGAAQWFSEGVATFGLVLTILATLRARAEAVPAAVALYITAAYWFTASTSFANPAVTIARSFTDSFSGILPAHAPAFIAAQLIGAVLALWAAKAIAGDRAT